LVFAVGCGRPVRHRNADGDSDATPSADDPQGYGGPAADLCLCAGGDLDGWIGQLPGNTEFGRVTLATPEPRFP
jgi:hypothetical protein